MAIRVTCPECGTGRDVTEEQRGKKVRCKKCDEMILVPAKAKAPAADEDDDILDIEEAEVVPVKKKAPAKTAARDADDDEIIEAVEPVKKKVLAKTVTRDDGNGVQKAPAKKKPVVAAAKPMKRRDEDDEDDRPRGKKGKKAPRSKGATIAIAAVLIVVIVGGLGTAAYFTFFKDKEDTVASGGEPKKPDGMNPGGGIGGGNPNPGGGNPNPGGGNPNPGGGNPNPGGGNPNPGGGNPNPGGGKPELVGDVGKVSKNDIYKAVLRSTCMIKTLVTVGNLQGIATGSGEVIDRENRLVLTNYHVVHGMRDFIVLFPKYDNDGKVIREKDVYANMAKAEDAVKGRVLANDQTHDCALLQLNRLPPEVDSIPFAKEEPGVGDSLHSVGNAGVSGALWVYTPGQVRSVYKKTYRTGNGLDLAFEVSSRIIEATSPTNPGDSGGPCCNDRGELVGITQGGLVGAEASMSYFVERSELEKFIETVFQKAAELRGKQWVRSTRPPIQSSNTMARNLPIYVDQLSDANATVRAQGVQGLLTLGPDARPAIKYLVKALADKSELVRDLAANALRQIGQPQAADLQYLLPVLESTSPEAKAYVLDALAALGESPEAESAADQVLSLTQDQDVKVRKAAMIAVGKMSKAVGDKKAVEALDKGLGDKDKRVRGAAALAVALATSRKFDVPKLREMLNRKEHAEVRIPAAVALGKLGEKGKPASKDLAAAVRDEEPALRRACLYALKAVKADPPDVTPVLKPCIQDNDPDVRRLALEAVSQAGPAARDLVPYIAGALADADARQAAMSALQKLGPDAESAAPNVAMLLVTDPSKRLEALTTLEAMKVGDSRALLVVPRLIAVFEDEKNPAVIDKTATVLGSLGKPAIIPLCQALQNQKMPAMRKGAAMSLNKMGTVGGLASKSLNDASLRESVEDVKNEMLKALRSVNGQPPLK